MSGKAYKENMAFEARVRKIAEAVWNLEAGDCQPGHYLNDPVVRELDGIARLRDITNLIMVTTSTKLEKVKSDVKKLNAAEVLERKQVAAVSKWLITEKQLDALHIDHAKKSNVTVLTLEDFTRRFFDGFSYISKRGKLPFGSARNPNDNSIEININAYVPLPIYLQEKVNIRKENQYEDQETPVDINYIKNIIQHGEIAILLAPFGAGKSLTTRELFNGLVKLYQEDKSFIPITINLREHWGQDYFDEILSRHARAIGYAPKEDLVVAWRAGMACILLDGFDEVASQAVIRSDDRNYMRDARKQALLGVRDFLTKIPVGTGVFMCGRDHYFDTENEMVHALGIEGKKYHILRLDEFTEEGANEFLKRNGIESSLPDWLPRKPLLLAYLTQHGLFDEILQIDSSQGFGYAWDKFLRLITEREAQLERAVMDPQSIRAVMERLAMLVRSRHSGTGPIAGTDLSEAYYVETGQVAGEGVIAQLQRLPGLTQRDQDPGARAFVDADMLAALQGSAFAKLILNPVKIDKIIPLSGISDNAIAMASHILHQGNATSETLIAITTNFAQRAAIDALTNQKLADCCAVGMNMSISESAFEIDFRGLTVESAMVEKLYLEDLIVNGLIYRNCIIGEILLGVEGLKGDLIFQSCIINKVSGVATEKGLPTHMFTSCTIEKFDNMTTNTAVLSMDIDPKLKALVTVLRKLYKQTGTGRKLSALRRGVTLYDVESQIDFVIDMLAKYGFITVFNQVVHPVRKQAFRVEKILSAPLLSNDPIVLKIMES
ncbi:NACHT domain-containing protein [Methylobacter tundripaludum]|uniref:NACHT domain-containing protein n=1 Tax=Methylobacter tundripaludum TaxID=173365 RepID=UPI0004861543|nr:hypothetical protein [Methylobacter tundripaludum]